MPIPKLPDNIKPHAPVFTNNFEYVNLPFPVLRLNWHNGNPHASKIEIPTAYFGGFHRGSVDVQTDLEAMQQTATPSYLKEGTWVNEDGENYNAFSARNLWCAPILAKVDWWEGKDKSGQPSKKHRADILVYLADRVNNVPIAWGYATLTAYGFAASNLEKAFKNFAQETRDARKKWAYNMDAMFFWHNIGTFGSERKVQKVGESAIVVCDVNLPKDGWTEELLGSMFVGEEIAAVMVEQAQEEAKEWAADLNSARQGKKEEAGGVPTGESVQFGSSIPPENFVGNSAHDPFGG